jgi:hypothetical protein
VDGVSDKTKRVEVALRDAEAKKKIFFAESESLNVAAEAKEKSLASDLDKVARILRTTLRENEACPVCGSLNHAVQGANQNFATTSDALSVVEKWEHLQKVWELAGKSSEAKSVSETAVMRAENLRKEMESAGVLLDELRGTLLQDLAVFGFAGKVLENVSATREQLKKWNENWTKCKSLLEQSSRESEAHQKNLALANAALDRELICIQAFEKTE